MAYLARMQYSVVNVGGTKVSEKGGGGLGWADIELSENKVNVCVDSAFQFHTASIMKEPKMMVRKTCAARNDGYWKASKTYRHEHKYPFRN